MKKIVIALLAATMALSGASAKKWTNNVGFGFTLPISQIGVDKSGVDDIFQIGYGLEGTYVGIHERGFTVKADLGAGLTASDDVALQGSDSNLGIFYNVAVGAGWTFVHTEKFTLSATGMLGCDVSVFFDSEDDVPAIGETFSTYESVDQICGLAMISAGADVFASYRIKEHFGVFANLSARYLIVGGSSYGTEYTYKKKNGHTATERDSSDGPDLAGKFRIQPTIGIIWNF